MDGYTTENLFQSSTATLEEISKPTSEIETQNTEPLLKHQNEPSDDVETKHVSFSEPPSESDQEPQETEKTFIENVCTKDNLFLLALLLILIALYFYFK